MSQDSGKGSIILKLVILILVVGLIVVIIIPGEIWDLEEFEQKTEQSNMMSIYEALRFYHRNTDSYTDKPAEILGVVRSDSSILIQQKVVNYTQQLAGLIDSYLSNAYIKGIVDVDQNIDRILEDLENNRRNFKIDENIKNEAENIELQLATLNNASQYTNYVMASMFLDSLLRLRRDLTDFSLQAGAARASYLVDSLESFIGDIDFSGVETAWQPISSRLETFVTTVRRSEDLIKVTSVGDRVKDFREAVDDAFGKIKAANVTQDVAQAKKINESLKETYDLFLKDFIATGKLALYRLADADSLVIHLTENNFYSPVTKEMYKIFIVDDSSAVKIESPILLKDLKEFTDPIASELKSLPIRDAFKEYLDTLETIKTKAYDIRRSLRKNTDVFIKYKEIEEIINRFADISVSTSYKDLDKFITEVPESESFSEIKDNLESTLMAVRIFHQAYQEQFFGNLDSLQRDLIVGLEEFNSLLDEVRRLPKGTEKFETEFGKIEQLQAKIKGLNVVSELGKIEADLSEALFFASEGKRQPMYVVFNKSIKNFGYIYKDNKSWEQEK